MCTKIRSQAGLLRWALALALFGIPLTAAAGQPEPPNPYLTGYSTYPGAPLSSLPAKLFLTGQWPYPCGELVEASVQDPAHVTVRIRHAAACPESTQVRWLWTQEFNLGFYEAGRHTVAVQLVVENDPRMGGGTSEAVETVAFDVLDDAPTTLPQPHGSWMIRCLGGWRPSAPPSVLQPTSITLWGWFPYFCGQVADARTLDPGHVELTLQPGAPCSDTVQDWSQTFDLGLLPVGPHPVQVALRVIGDPDSAASQVRTASFEFEVQDSVLPPPPPPPPPVDSIPRLSASHPNPFTRETSFTVTLRQRVDDEVSIFDISGRRVTLIHRGTLAEGDHEFRWDGHRADGSLVPSGLYFYRLSVRGRILTRRVVLIARK